MIELKAKTVEMDAMSEEQCWEVIERAAALLTQPGAMQVEMKDDPVIGPLFKANYTELMAMLVEHYDSGTGPESEEISNKVSNLFGINQQIQSTYLIKILTDVSVAMQQLPITKLIESIEAPTAMEGLTQEQIERLESFNTEQRQTGFAKLDPRVMAIMSAGIAAAGGHMQFAEIQRDIVAGMPKEITEMNDPSVLFTGQMIGAVMHAITARSASPEMVVTQARATIESVIGAKQALSIANVAVYSMSAADLVDTMTYTVGEHTKRAVATSMKLRDETAKPATAAPKTQVQAEATHIAAAKPDSFRFDGNRTIN
jgi:hypothetical protein